MLEVSLQVAEVTEVAEVASRKVAEVASRKLCPSKLGMAVEGAQKVLDEVARPVSNHGATSSMEEVAGLASAAMASVAGLASAAMASSCTRCFAKLPLWPPRWSSLSPLSPLWPPRWSPLLSPLWSHLSPATLKTLLSQLKPLSPATLLQQRQRWILHF